MTTTPLPAGQVVLYERATGHRLVRWSVDARELLATGDYATSPETTPAVADDVPATPVVERPTRPRRARAA